jgi:hypothetical protein
VEELPHEAPGATGTAGASQYFTIPPVDAAAARHTSTGMLGDITVRVARSRFFAASGFDADGGYDRAWADERFGPFAYSVPNSRARARALRIHDVHHLVTGYPTSWRGEASISAWELGSGWGRLPYAWVIALFGFFTGLLAEPRAMFRAFLRGRASANLYDRGDIEPLLDRSLAELARELRVPPEGTVRASAADVVRFAATALSASAFALLAAVPVVALVILGEARRVAIFRASGWRCPFSSAVGA